MIKWRWIFWWLAGLGGWVVTAADLPALQLVRTHTNMIGLVQAPTTASARQHLGITDSGSAQEAVSVIATFGGLTNVTRDTNGAPQIVQTRGFYAEGDRGGATYLWRSTAPTGQTNIYTIAANGGGYWVEEDYLRGLICNVVKAGATAFDSNDDYNAVQLALQAASQQSTGNSTINKGDEPTIYFPAGRYFNATGPWSYVNTVGTARDEANISIRGDGANVTLIYASFAAPPRDGGWPAFYLAQGRFNVSGLHLISQPSDTTDYGRVGFHLRNGEKSYWYDVRVSGFSRALVLDNPSMNWNTFHGLQTSGGYYGIVSAANQGVTIEAHSSGTRVFWFGPYNGLILNAHVEGAVGDEFMPAMMIAPAGLMGDLTYGYNEGSTWVGMFGTPITNRVTLSVANQTNITAVFTNAHVLVPDYVVQIYAEQSVPSDIQTGILGARTITGGYRTNNWVTFNASNPITNSLNGLTFLMVRDFGANAVTSTKLFARNWNDSGGYSVILDSVNGFELGGDEMNVPIMTARSYNVRMPPNGAGQWARTPGLNLFPDPTFKAGTNWIVSPVTVLGNAALVATNIDGIDGVLFYCTAKPGGSYSQYRADFNLLQPLKTGERVSLAGRIMELNHPAYRPSGFSVVNGGSGYTDGVASVVVDGRTVQVTLTTSGGAITGATWYFGAFLTNNYTTAMEVVQGGASGGTILPTGYQDYSYRARRSFRAPTISLVKPGTVDLIGAGPVRFDSYIPSWDDKGRMVQVISGWAATAGAEYTKLQLRFDDAWMTSSEATGCEAFFVSFLAVLKEPQQWHRDTYRDQRIVTPYETAIQFLSAAKLGKAWPGVSGADVSRIFAGPESGVTTMRIQRDNGSLVTIPGSWGNVASEPAGGVVGDLALVNNQPYIRRTNDWYALTGGGGGGGGSAVPAQQLRMYAVPPNSGTTPAGSPGSSWSSSGAVSTQNTIGSGAKTGGNILLTNTSRVYFNGNNRAGFGYMNLLTHVVSLDYADYNLARQLFGASSIIGLSSHNPESTIDCVAFRTSVSNTWELLTQRENSARWTQDTGVNISSNVVYNLSIKRLNTGVYEFYINNSKVGDSSGASSSQLPDGEASMIPVALQEYITGATMQWRWLNSGYYYLDVQQP